MIEARAARLGRAAARPRPALARAGWSAGGSSTRTSAASSTCRCRTCSGPHQIVNAGAALAALRALGARRGGLRGRRDAGRVAGADAAAATGRLARAGRAGRALARRRPQPGGGRGGRGDAAGDAAACRPISICGMLNTKDVAGFMRPLAGRGRAALGRVDPRRGEHAARRGDRRGTPRGAGLPAEVAPGGRGGDRGRDADGARSRILICGSLYLAGHVLTTGRMIRARRSSSPLWAARRPQAELVHFCWAGSNGYTMTGSMEFPDALARAPISSPRPT